MYGEGNGNPLQHSCRENPVDRGPWWATVQGVAKSQTQLSDFTFTFFLMYSLSSTFKHYSVPPTPVLLPGKSHGWRSSGGLQSMGSLGVGHD